MSSHREAPEISKDPVADSTDLYAFVSPDNPSTVTFLANYVPLQGPAGGPNFYEFGDDVLYQIHIDNDNDADVDITFEFRFTTRIDVGGTFLYNVGPISTIDSPNWNRKQFFTLTRIDWERPHPHAGPTKDRRNRRTCLARNVPCPPCNVGVRSTPNYPALANAAITNIAGGGKVFAGQRAEGFYVDLGSIFDLGVLRPFQNLHLIPLPSAAAVNATKDLNVHSIALQIPKTQLTRGGVNPTDPAKSSSVIGVWTTASRQRVRIVHPGDAHDGRQSNPANIGPWTQVSRLGNPLFNEVLVPMEEKDDWNHEVPAHDHEYADGVLHPELAKLLPILYPGVFPNLKAYTKPRADLAAILLTGIPSGVITGFQNFTGTTQADLLRLNMAFGPTASPSNLGILGGDFAGFPNGRRPADNVVAIELRAIAGATIPLVDNTFTPDGAAGLLEDGTAPVPLLSTFPYLGTPHNGFETPAA
jgi:Domain of unknown function (DUF4331)